MPKFRKKPDTRIFQPEQFQGGVETGGYKIPNGVCFCSDGDDPETLVHRFHVHTIHKGQIVILEDGDWVMPEPDGEHFYPIKPDIFEATYEPAN